MLHVCHNFEVIKLLSRYDEITHTNWSDDQFSFTSNRAKLNCTAEMSSTAKYGDPISFNSAERIRPCWGQRIQFIFLRWYSSGCCPNIHTTHYLQRKTTGTITSSIPENTQIGRVPRYNITPILYFFDQQPTSFLWKWENGWPVAGPGKVHRLCQICTAESRLSRNWNGCVQRTALGQSFSLRFWRLVQLGLVQSTLHVLPGGTE